MKDREPVDEGTSIRWNLAGRDRDGTIPGARRSVGTVQKDWAKLKSNELPADFCIAVRGHKGWSRDPDVSVRYALCVSIDVIGQEMPVYEPLMVALEELQAELAVEAEAEVEVEA